MEDTEFMTVDEMRRYLRIGITTAYQLVKSEGFPAVRISPRRIVIPKDALEKWLSDKKKLTCYLKKPVQSEANDGRRCDHLESPMSEL